MAVSVPVLMGIVDLAALAADAAADVGSVLGEHRADGADGPLLAELVVPDQRLAETSRAAADVGPLSVCVLTTTGAGGLLALARRSLPHVEVVAVQSALRDLDDLTGNAARLASAAVQLGESIAVYVEIPYAPGWQRAVDAVEAAGLLGAVRLTPRDPDPSAVAGQVSAVVEQLSAFVEADLPFRVNGSPRLSVLSAVHALIEGASPDQATEVLLNPEPSLAGAVLSGWDEADAARVRRRVRRLEYSSRSTLREELAAAGLTG